MANWDPKVNPFAGLLGQKPARAEPPRRLSMRAMKAVDLKGLGPDDVLEVDEFSVGGALGGAPVEPPDDAAGRGEQARRGDRRAQEQAQQQAREQVGQQHAGQAKLRDPKKGMPALRPEAFGPPQTAGADAKLGVQKAHVPTPDVQKLPPRPLQDPNFSALIALDNAQDPGVYFKEDREHEGHSEDQEDPALREAVEECIRRLFGVRGIHHVGPGRNEKDQPVIVVATGEGFSHESMAAVPDQVNGYPTIISLSFDLVPLRRSR